jgi:Cu-processing system permease protein
MMNLWLIEWRTITRQRSYYACSLLWIIVFSLLFLLEKNNSGLTGFTNTTGTIVNIIIYLLPLFMMLYGSFSIANEVENGQWELLCTYPLSIPSYILGKFAGLYTSQSIVFTFSFGLSMAIGLIAGIQLPIKWLLNIYLFSLLLIYAFIILGLFFGTLVNTKWKALTLSVSAWFFLIMIWPTALISVLGLVPYPMIGVIMKIAMVLNPAEFLRVFLISKWNSGSIFGQSYDSIVQLFQSGVGWLVLIGYLFTYLFLFFAFSNFFMWRRRLK